MYATDTLSPNSGGSATLHVTATAVTPSGGCNITINGSVGGSTVVNVQTYSVGIGVSSPIRVLPSPGPTAAPGPGPAPGGGHPTDPHPPGGTPPKPGPSGPDKPLSFLDRVVGFVQTGLRELHELLD